MTTPILSVKNLTKSYPGFTMRDISFSLPGGCILGLIGENGAGKTTLIRSLLGLSMPDSGSVLLPKQEELGVVFDDCRFHESLSAQDVGRINAAIYRNWDKARYRQLCSRFSLPEKKFIKQYSKGMKMKLSIAAALSHHPRLLLLDEPTSGLDPVVRDEILELFLEFIGDEEHSILLSSHITTDLERVADYIAFMQGGQLRFCRPKDELAQCFWILKSGASLAEKLDKTLIAGQRANDFGVQTLLQLPQQFPDAREWAVKQFPDAQYLVEPATLDEIMLLFHKGQP